MVSKVTESDKRNQAIAQMLQKEKEDSQKSENSKLLQLEARMEKQLMDFDIEREQYKSKVRREEAKVKELVQQLTDIKQTVLSLQHQSTHSGRSTSQSINLEPVPTDTAKTVTGGADNSRSQDVNNSNESGTAPSTLVINSASSAIPQSAKLIVGPSLVPPASVTSPSKEQNLRPTAVASSVTAENLNKPDPGKSMKPISAVNRTSSTISAAQKQSSTTNLYSTSSPGASTTPKSASSATKASSPASAMKSPQVTAVRSPYLAGVVNPKPQTQQTVGSGISTKATSAATPERSETSPKLFVTDQTKSSPQSIRTNISSAGKVLVKPSSGILQNQTNRDQVSTNRAAMARQVSDKGPSVKQKPAPPVRNVSLPSTRKYKPIDNSKKLITSSNNSTS